MPLACRPRLLRLPPPLLPRQLSLAAATGDPVVRPARLIIYGVGQLLCSCNALSQPVLKVKTAVQCLLAVKSKEPLMKLASVEEAVTGCHQVSAYDLVECCTGHVSCSVQAGLKPCQ